MPAICFVLPLSMLSSSASSSAFSSMRSARRQISASRWAGSIVAQGPRSKASRAAATALSTSARLASAIEATSSPVAGSITGMRSGALGCTHSPPINSLGGRRKNAATPAEGAGWAAIATLNVFPDLLVMEPNSVVRSVEPGSRCPQGAPRRDTAGQPLVLSSAELEQVDRVALENQRSNLVANVDLREVGEPPLRGDQRIVRTEQHFSFQLSVRVLHELRWEILRRPAGEVDVDLRLVQGDRQRLVLPRPRRMSEHDRHRREIDGYIVDVHRIAVLQPDTSATRHTSTHSGVPRVKESGQLVLRDDFIEWIRGTIVGKKLLKLRMKLEAFDAVVLDQPARFAHSGRTTLRVDARERDHDVGVLRR